MNYESNALELEEECISLIRAKLQTTPDIKKQELNTHQKGYKESLNLLRVNFHKESLSATEGDVFKSWPAGTDPNLSGRVRTGK